MVHRAHRQLQEARADPSERGGVAGAQKAVAALADVRRGEVAGVERVLHAPRDRGAGGDERDLRTEQALQQPRITVSTPAARSGAQYSRASVTSASVIGAPSCEMRASCGQATLVTRTSASTPRIARS